MQVLKFVTGIAAGTQASWLHVSRHSLDGGDPPCVMGGCGFT